MFTKAIVKKPCKALVDGITDHPELGTPDYEKALAQHAAYVQALQQCGLDVTVLEADEAFPDSCFVEDTAVLTPYCAVITNPGAPSRKAEVQAMEPVIAQFYPADKIFHIQAPGTLEGGDVMMVGDTYYVGLSKRTNEEGVAQLAAILAPYGCKVVGVPLTEVLHLKTGVVYLENGVMLGHGEFLHKPVFADYTMLAVPDGEDYAANCLWINDKVLVPAGYPHVLDTVQKAGYSTIVCDTSEYKKIDGGLSCLSLRF
jgi:dimethylargininase